MEIAICDEVVIAPHNLFKCFGCCKKIKKGLPVVRKGETGKFGYQSHSYCNKCFKSWILALDKRRLDEVVARNKEVEKKFKLIVKKCTKELIMEELEEQKANG